jgi:hypothetical protein
MILDKGINFRSISKGALISTATFILTALVGVWVAYDRGREPGTIKVAAAVIRSDRRLATGSPAGAGCNLLYCRMRGADLTGAIDLAEAPSPDPPFLSLGPVTLPLMSLESLLLAALIEVVVGVLALRPLWAGRG